MRRNLWTLNLTLGAISFAYYAWDPILPNELTGRGASATTVAWVFTLRSAGFWCFQLLGGWMADRWGRVPCIVWPSFLNAALYFIAATSVGVWPLALALVGTAFLSSIQFPSILAITAESSAEGRRGRAFAWFELLASVGAGGGPLFGALLLGRGHSFALLLGVTGVVYALCGLARWLGFREPPTPRVRFTFTGLRERLTPGFWRAVWAVGLVHFVWGLTFMGPFVALDAEADRLMTRAGIDRMFGIAWIVAIPICFLSGRAVDRFGARALIGVSLLVHAALALAWFHGPGEYAYALFLASIAAAQVSIVAAEVLMTEGVDSSWRGMLLGVMGLIIGALQGAAPLAGEWMRMTGGRQASYVLAVVVAAATWIVAGRRRPAAAPDAAPAA